MLKTFMGLGCAATLVMASSAQAGYVLEIDTDGADDGVLVYHPNFSFGGDTTTASQSALSTAVGLTGGDSIYGGNGVNFPDTYLATYTPALDGDNNGTNPVAGQALNQFGVLGSALAAGGTGLYDVYATWPHTTNVSGNPITFTLSDGVGSIFSVQLDQNTAMPPRDVTGDGVPDPGTGGEWIYLGSANLDANTTYTLSQEAGSNTFVSMRAAGYLFDAVPEPASLSLLGLGALAMLRRK